MKAKADAHKTDIPQLPQLGYPKGDYLPTPLENIIKSC